MILLFALASAILNRLRGWGGPPKRFLAIKAQADKLMEFEWEEKWWHNIIEGLSSKGLTSFYMGIMGYCFTGDWIIAAIVFIGMWAWAVAGWGKYFMAFHGRQDVRSEDEVAWIDKVIDGLNIKSNFTYGAIGMSLRGLHILPLFIGLSIHLGDVKIVAIGLACGAIQGVVYYVMRYVKVFRAVTFAELIYGAVIGASIYGSIYYV